MAVEPETRDGAAGDAAPAKQAAGGFPRSRFLETVTVGLGAVIGGLVTRAGRRVRASCRGFLGQKKHEVDLGPVTEFRRGPVADRDVHGQSEEGEVSRRTAFVRNNGADRRQGAELHDHLEPLRAPRLSGAGERPDRETDVKTTEDRQRQGTPDPDDSRRLRLPVPRRPVRHRGQPHCRPAGARTRPLRLRDQERQPHPAQHVLGLARRRHGRAGEDPQVQAGRPGRARRRLEQWFYPSTRRITDGHAPTAHARPRSAAEAADRDRLSARLARGAVRSRRRRQVLPLPPRPRGHELDADARLGDAHRVPRAGGHRRDPRDVLPADADRRVSVDPTSPTT